MLELIVEDWEGLFEEYKPMIYKTIQNRLKSHANELMSKIPMEKMFVE